MKLGISKTLRPPKGVARKLPTCRLQAELVMRFRSALSFSLRSDWPRWYSNILVFSSQSVRSYWGSLMRAGTARRDYPDIQLNNIITLATRVRITILRVSNGLVIIKVVRLGHLSFCGICLWQWSSISFQGIADAYRLLHPRGTAVVTQFQARPQLLVRLEKTHRATSLSFAEAIFSPLLPPPTKESLV
jgi:hypothetical protein